MKIRYSYQGIPFEWDSAKAIENLNQHEISFETAYEALLDPFVRMVDIEDFEGEVRETIIGMSVAWKLLYVVYTIREGETFRIISARKTTKPERKLYEEQ